MDRARAPLGRTRATIGRVRPNRRTSNQHQRRDDQASSPPPSRRRRSTAASLLTSIAVAAISSGCTIASRNSGGETCVPIIERSIDVRGGPIANLRRKTEMAVHFGFPGIWQLEYVFKSPDLYRWTVFTSEEPNHYWWDGSTMRAAVGPVVVGIDTSGRAPLRSHARWHAVMYLDALCNGNLPVRFSPLAAESNGEQSVLVRLLDDGSEYELTFDRLARLRKVIGPIEIPPFGKARLTHRFYDFRDAGGFLIAHGTRYDVDGITLSEETTTSFIANDPALDDSFFRHTQ